MEKKNPCLSTDEWISKLSIFCLDIEIKWISKCCIVMQQCYSAMKTNEVLTHATIWMNLENVRLSERKSVIKDHI